MNRQKGNTIDRAISLKGRNMSVNRIKSSNDFCHEKEMLPATEKNGLIPSVFSLLSIKGNDSWRYFLKIYKQRNRSIICANL